MYIRANLNVELDHEAIDDIVVQTLKNDYISIYDDYKALVNSTEELQSFQKEDMEHFKGYLDALETLLKYYMYVLDAEEFIRGVKGVYISEK